MLEQFNKYAEDVLNKIKEACANPNNTIDDLQQIFNKYFGANSELKQKYTIKLKELAPDEKKLLGQAINALTRESESIIKERQNFLDEQKFLLSLEKEKIDITLEAKKMNHGSVHPINLVLYKIHDIFKQLGYTVIDGQEVETDLYNFEKLNIPKGHPAREMQDSFFIDEENLLRTHCTNATAHVLSTAKKNMPVRVVSTGNVYRKDDDDATHSHQFTQIDVVNLGQGITLANLKWTLEFFAKEMFGEKTQIRMRPSFFPFTEPSMEVDVTCVHCKGKGCFICKKTGWIEILGAGMLHPNVLELCGHDPKLIQGFAFGIGAERIAMLKYHVSDIRYFYNNDIRFLKQFKKF